MSAEGSDANDPRRDRGDSEGFGAGGGPYTPNPMEGTRRGLESLDGRFDGLHAEAKEAIGYLANSLRAIQERYREAYHEERGHWQSLRVELDSLERAPRDARTRLEGPDRLESAESDAEDTRLHALRMDVETLTTDLELHRAELAKLDLVGRHLENTWLFLERGDASLVSSAGGSSTPEDVQMRIVQAQEAERSRLAQEVHDGPTQALTNAIFQVEYIERVLEQDPGQVPRELRFLRELLRRELGDVRSFISRLRPPLLDQLGLDGAIRDTVENMTALTGLVIETDLQAPVERLSEGGQTALLRVVQEALQNARKHADAKRVTVATRTEGSDIVTEVSDDGTGFDPGSLAVQGRRTFGLQFMRERAELIGARFEVRSRPGEGTVVWLAIPMGEE